MSGQDDFAERLRRLEAKRGTVPHAGVSGGNTSPGNTPPRRSSGSGSTGLLRAVLLAGITLVIGSAAVTFIAPGVLPQAAANVTGREIEKDRNHIPLLSLFQRRQDVTPTEALPAAPAGWLRVTEADTENVEAIKAVYAEVAASVESPVALADHPGIRSLENFIAIYDDPDFETRALASYRATAYYVSPEGTFLEMRFRTRVDGEAYADPAVPQAWYAGLRAEATRKLQGGETLEELTLAGLKVIHTANESVPLRAPIGEELDRLASLDLLAAPSAYARIELSGLATAAQAAALLAAVDLDFIEANWPQ